MAKMVVPYSKILRISLPGPDGMKFTAAPRQLFRSNHCTFTKRSSSGRWRAEIGVSLMFRSLLRQGLLFELKHGLLQPRPIRSSSKPQILPNKGTLHLFRIRHRHRAVQNLSLVPRTHPLQLFLLRELLRLLLRLRILRCPR